MTRLSIVIPVVGRTNAFEAGLVSVLTQRPENCEILAVFNGPYADPYSLEDEVRFVQAPSGASWTQSVNRGILAANGEIVHVLDAGASVAEGWTEPACEALSEPTCSAACATIQNNGKSGDWAGQVLSQGRMQRTRLKLLKRKRRRDLLLPKLTPLAEASYFRREDVLTLCGLSELLPPDLAVADLALRMKTAGGEVSYQASAPVTTLGLPVHSAFAQGLGQERFFLSQLERVHVPTLAFRALAGLPSLLIGRIGPASGIARFIGRLAAWLTYGKTRDERGQQEHLIAELAEQLERRSELVSRPKKRREERTQRLVA